MQSNSTKSITFVNACIVYIWQCQVQLRPISFFVNDLQMHNYNNFNKIQSLFQRAYYCTNITQKTTLRHIVPQASHLKFERE